MTDIKYTTDFMDIDNAPPGYYHDFKGAKLRIQVFWTTDVLADLVSFRNSLRLIEHANKILQKYTLSLDVLPTLAPEGLHQKIRTEMNKRLASIPGAKKISSYVPGVLRSWAGEVIDSVVDDVVDLNHAKFNGVLKSSGSVYSPYEGTIRREELNPLREAMGHVDENRLVVVFLPVGGGGGGSVILYPEWVPWVILDPKSFFSKSLLLHELGHACRLAHQRGNGNVMSEIGEDRSQMWGWQVDTMYDSYYCNGPKPDEWWVRKPRPPWGPFMWD